MKKLGLGIFYFLVVIYSIIFFTPKINLYYQLEILLQEKQIVITQENIVDSGFSLSIEEGSLYYGDLLVGQFDKVSILSLLFFNSVSLDPFALSQDMEIFFPRNIQGLTLTHAFFNPLHVKIQGSGDFGEINGDVNLLDRTIVLNLQASKVLLSKKPFWMKKLKKDETGAYRYATTY